MGTILEAINIFLYVYGVFFAFVALLGFGVQRNKERSYTSGSNILPEDITVLIPFRNESENLPALLECINALKYHPYQFIFINDHSEDGSQALVEAAKETLPITLISMEEGQTGKKNALRAGAKRVTTRYTLTWDADIVIAPEYFHRVAQLTDADMYILPAIFTSKSFFQSLFSFDVIVANAVNTGLAGWYRPIFASGANLLYSTRLFEDYDTHAKHGHISSGDDTFLLHDFIRNKADVRLSTDTRLAVKTEVPASFNAYFSQRLRWVSKTNALGDWLNTLMAIKQLLLMVAFVALLVWSAMHAFWFGLVYLLLCKCLTDFLIFSAYFKQTKQLRLLLLLPIAELWFPLYSLLLAIMVPFYKPKWKGREIVSS